MTTTDEIARVSQARQSTRAMTWKYALVLGLVGALSIFDYVFVNAQRKANETSTEFVIEASREITLVERIAGLSRFLSDAEDAASRAVIREKLLAATSEVEAVHQALSRSSLSGSHGLAAAVISIDFNAPRKVDAQLAEYVDAARALAASSGTEPQSNNPRLAVIRNAILGNQLTLTMDRLAGDYREKLNKDLHRLNNLLLFDLIAKMAILLAAGALIFMPMTRRIRSEVAKMAAAEAYSRAIVESAGEGIIATDGEGRIESFNPAAERMFGLEANAARGRKAATLMPWPAPGVGGISSAGGELRGTRSDGSTFPLELTTAELQMEGRDLRIGVVRDISERRRLEREMLQSERLATIGSMSAALSHEIRNPLGSIKLNLELLQDEIEGMERGAVTSTEEAASLLRPIASEVQRIHRVTESYLRFAKLPRGELAEESLNEILCGGIAFMRSQLELAKVRLVLDLDDTLPRLPANAEHLWQALMNLIRNAIEAMPDGGLLTLSTFREGGDLAIRIADSGKGMSEEQRAHLFEPFFTTKHAGTGLGLALAQRIVHEHGGAIECRSVAGGGAAFTIRLPTRGPAQSKIAPHGLHSVTMPESLNSPSWPPRPPSQ